MKNKNFDLQCKVLDRVDEIRSDFTIVPEYASKEMPSRMDLAISLDYADLTNAELENLLTFRDGDFGHDVFVKYWIVNLCHIWESGITGLGGASEWVFSHKIEMVI